MIPHLTDQWYTPVDIIADYVQWVGAKRLADYCTCDEAVSRLVEDPRFANVDILFDNQDALKRDQPFHAVSQFLNPPYSKASGGAEAFVRHLLPLHLNGLALVNYGTWIARVVRVIPDLQVGLLDRRVQFEPSEALEYYLRARAEASGKVWTNSPRYDNVFLYKGILRPPSSLGGYNIEWVK